MGLQYRGVVAVLASDKDALKSGRIGLGNVTNSRNQQNKYD